MLYDIFPCRGTDKPTVTALDTTWLNIRFCQIAACSYVSNTSTWGAMMERDFYSDSSVERNSSSLQTTFHLKLRYILNILTPVIVTFSLSNLHLIMFHIHAVLKGNVPPKTNVLFHHHVSLNLYEFILLNTKEDILTNDGRHAYMEVNGCCQLGTIICPNILLYIQVKTNIRGK